MLREEGREGEEGEERVIERGEHTRGMNVQVLLDELLQFGLLFLSMIDNMGLLQLCVLLRRTKDNHFAAEITGREREIQQQTIVYRFWL